MQLGGEAVVTKSTIRDVLAHPTQGWGDGLAAIQQGDTSLTIDEVVITNVARAGIASFGAPVTVTATYSWCNGFHLNGEPFAGRDATFDDLGGNHCGCGDSEEPCKVVSEDLSPPSL